jgi:glycosyltransferase involved in cell wall biosynthesis
MAAYNTRRMIQEAVASALDQEGVITRVFIVDDGSDDGLAEEVAGWGEKRVSLIRHGQRRGMAAARNTAIAQGSGEWIACLDADDLWPRDRCRVLLDHITDQFTDIVYGAQIVFPAGDRPSLIHPCLPAPAISVPGPLAGTTMMGRRLFESVGNFDESMELADFVAWMVERRTRHPQLREIPVPCVALLRRSHQTNSTRTMTAHFSAYLQAVARHRAASREADGPGMPR